MSAGRTRGLGRREICTMLACSVGACEAWKLKLEDLKNTGDQLLEAASWRSLLIESEVVKVDTCRRVERALDGGRLRAARGERRGTSEDRSGRWVMVGLRCEGGQDGRPSAFVA